MWNQNRDQYIATISVVIPVYQGEATIGQVVDELASYIHPSISDTGLKYVVSEVLLVNDCCGCWCGRAVVV